MLYQAQFPLSIRKNLSTLGLNPTEELYIPVPKLYPVISLLQNIIPPTFITPSQSNRKYLIQKHTII